MENLNVLVVDDEAGMRLGVQRALRDYTVRLNEVEGEYGFEVTQAETGEQAMEIIGENPPDILLLDHKLPGMSGLDVLKKLPDDEGRMLTIVITAYASLDTAVTATKRGAYDFLAKPFTPDELRGVVRKAARHLLIRRQAEKLAEEKRQVRFQFISVLAHELKSPLSAVEGYLRIIRDGSAGDDAEAYKHMLDRSLTRLEGMRKLILDLLDLTRIESGQKQRDIAEQDVVEIAREALDGARAADDEKNLTLELHAEGPAPLKCDRGEVEIVLNNLISNAVKYNKPEGRVDVTVSRDDDAVTISVADTGIGMAEEETERLFQEFTRIKNEKTRNILGSGLGLSIVQKLVSLYGGEVNVSSESDVGSTFTVTLRHADTAQQNDQQEQTIGEDES
ncbi:MAG: sensor histidine kinase [Phycisphaerae bacterium]